MGNDGSNQFRVQDWKASDALSRSPSWKQLIYAAARPAISRRARRHLSAGTLESFVPNAVLGGRGMPLEARRRRAAPCRSLGGRTVLVQGTGSGWDVLSWAALGPARIIATDLFEFDDWETIARFCADHLGVKVDFRCAPLECHAFVKSGAIDVCGSDAVFEHCRDMPAVLSEAYRVIRPGGSLYAAYGPLWYSAGGDHFSGRGGLTHAFAHIEYPAADYAQYFEAQRLSVEDFQSGGRYVELDLFSKMTTAQYLAAFQEAGFVREWLVLEVSLEAIEFRRKFPDRLEALAEKYVGSMLPDDLVLKGNIVRLRKPCRR